MNTRIVAALGLSLVLFSGASAQKKNSPAAAPPSSSPQGGPSSNAPFEIQMLSYGGLDQLLNRIAVYTCGRVGNAKLLVVDAPALQSLQAFDSFYANAEALKSGFNTMAGAAGAGGIDTFADITNAVVAAATASNAESAYSSTIQDPSIAIALIHQLQQQKPDPCKAPYYAGIYAVDEAQPPSAGTVNTVPKELSSLAAARATALRTILNKGQGGACPAGTTPNNQDPCVIAFGNLDGSYNTFLGTLSAPNPTTGQPLLSSVLQGYNLRSLLKSASEDSPIIAIYVSLVSAGGTQQVRKNLLTAVFTGDLIRYSGGVSLNVVVFKAARTKSEILFADLMRYRTGLTTVAKPKDEPAVVKAGDNLGDLPQ